MIMVTLILLAITVVGRAVSRWPSPGASASSLIHRLRVRGDLRAAHHPARMMCSSRLALTMAR
jgi:hypothetical protein